jgi:hypothetical protein
MEVINNVTMLSIVLTGAALIREREHGTIEHLLVMPVTPFEIMTSKVWAMGWWCWSPAPCHCSAWCRDCWRCRSKVRSAAVPGRRHAASVRHHLDGHLPRHPGPIDAAVRPAADAGAAAVCRCSRAE